MKQASTQHTNKLFIIFLSITLLTNTSLCTPPRFDERLMSPDEVLSMIVESQKQEEACEIRAISPKKYRTAIVFMAADNDLSPFAWKNLKQMEQVGSTEFINIIVQINTPGHNNPTKRYIVKKGRRILVQDDTSPNTKLNSGSPHTLIDCVRWAVQHYPADQYDLFFWNHGSAAIDPNFTKTMNPCDLFYCDPIDNMLKIDRGISYMTLLSQMTSSHLTLNGKRGICFDDTFKSYISNADLDFALKEIHQNILGGQNLGLVVFDACLMSMIEICSIVRKYADFMVTSQEVVYGTGQNYEMLFKPFLTRSLTSEEFARHIVLAYEQAYHKIINDYTFSALNLKQSERLESNVNTVATLLQEALNHQTNYSVSNMLRKCKSTQFCTCFDEPSYVDLGDLYNNVLRHVPHINLKNKEHQTQLQTNLTIALEQGLNAIKQLVIENRVGQKLQRAQGISIYFPEHAIAPNYFKSPFAQNNLWSQMLSKYIHS